MSANDFSSANDVGFGKPPKQSRFRKGVSGNPRGRPRGTKNLATVLEQTLREKVVINEDGIRKTVTKLEAAIQQLVNKAASGDLAAMKHLSVLANSIELEAAPAQKMTTWIEADQKILNRVLKRLQDSQKEKNNVADK